MKEVDPARTTIGSLFKGHDRCVYEYDFGDSWEHAIIVERSLKQSESIGLLLCLVGARHRPPEDVGGVGGYESFLSSIRDETDPKGTKT